MKFAFDYDGVISDQPEFFACVSRALKAAGHEVYILSDFEESFRHQRIKEIEEDGIAYDELVITANKQQFCLEHQVDFALDDFPADYYPGYPFTNVSIVSFQGE